MGLIFAFLIKNFLNKNISIERQNLEKDVMSKSNYNNVMEVNSNEEKTTPNTVIIFKKKYIDCGHEAISKATIPEEMVNLTKNEVLDKYPEWKVEEFSKKEVVLSKEINGFCRKHFFLIEQNGEINLYSVDKSGNKKFNQKIDIAIEYLPETDRITLRNGIMIYGLENLNKALEDFET